MRNTPVLLGILSAMTLAWAQQPQPAADPVVLSIGADKITKAQFEQIMEQASQPQPGQPRPPITPEARRQLAENLGELIALAQEARAEKLEDTPDVKLQLFLRTNQILASSLFQKINAGIMPAEADKRAYFNEHKQDWEQVTARHILIRFQGSAVPLKDGQKDLTDEEALAKTKDLRAKIVAGGDFAAIAKAESDDTGSGANGGDLGEFTRGRMVPQFEESAFSLPVNQVSEPVKSQFGYHLIQVQKHETKKFEDVQDEISEKIKPEMAQKAVDNLKNKVTITFDQTYFGK